MSQIAEEKGLIRLHLKTPGEALSPIRPKFRTRGSLMTSTLEQGGG